MNFKLWIWSLYNQQSKGCNSRDANENDVCLDSYVFNAKENPRTLQESLKSLDVYFGKRLFLMW